MPHTSKLTGRSVNRIGQAQKALRIGGKVYRKGQFVPEKARIKASKLRSEQARHAAEMRWAKIRFEPMPVKKIRPVAKIGKLYRTMIVWEAVPTRPTINTPTPLFEIGIFVFSHTKGKYSPGKLNKALAESVFLALDELGWTKAGFREVFQTEQELMHASDNERVDKDEQIGPLDSAQRYMFWYERGGHTFGDMDAAHTKYDEEYFKGLEARYGKGRMNNRTGEWE